MSDATSFKPEGYHTLTPYFAVDNAAAAISFYEKAFGAVECKVKDPFGHKWSLATHVEDVDDDEMAVRAAAFAAEMAGG